MRWLIIIKHKQSAHIKCKNNNNRVQSKQQYAMISSHLCSAKKVQSLA